MNKKLKGRLAGAFTALMLLVTGPTIAGVDLPGGQYTESVEDLRIKVMGGYVVMSRAWVDREWHFNSAWDPLKFEYDSIDGSVKTISRTGAFYKKTTDDVFVLDARNTINKTSTGYRWRDRSGNWIDYDEAGRITAYGDRNDVKVTFQYNSNDQLEGVFDHFGTQVLWYEYTNGKVSAIRDLANRRVEYQYTGNQLTTVVDVLANAWTYTYQPNKYIDYQCTIEWQYINGQLVNVADRCDPIEVDDGTFRLISRTDPELRKLTLGYGADGRVTSVKDPANNTTTYRYDYDATKKQYYVKQTSPAGKVTETWYDDKSKVIRQDVNGQTITALTKDGSNEIEQDQRGLQTRKEYDQWENLTKITYPDGAAVSYKYEPVYGNVTEKVNENGVITKYQYDAHGNLTKLIEAFGRPEQRVTEYGYDAYGNRTFEKRVGDAITAEAVTRYTYGNKGNVESITDAGNHVTGYTYHVTGQPLLKTDALGKKWMRAYDNAGRLKSETNPLQQVTRYEYDNAGLRTKVIDPVNNQTVYSYTPSGNIETITDPYGIIRYDYDAEGRVIKVTDQEGKVKSTVYDAQGRTKTLTDGNGNVIEYVYGEGGSGLDGQLHRVIYPTYSEEFKYDTRGRIVQTIRILDTVTRYTTTQGFDPAGNQTSNIDAEGRTTGYEYDGLNRLVKIIDAAQGLIEYAYDSRDNLLSVEDPATRRTRYEYDRNNQRTTGIRPMGQTTVYFYGPTGKLAEVTDANGQTKKFRYNDAGWLQTEQHYTPATGATPVKTVRFSYNDCGQLISYDDGTTSGTYAYDLRQMRKLGETVDYGPFSLSYGYTYSANGHKKTFTGPDAVTVNYSYDNNNQLTSIQLPTGTYTINQYQWLAPAQITFPGGTARNERYDPLLRSKAVQVRGPLQGEVVNRQYTYDRVGNLSERVTETGTSIYAYDVLDRLKTAQHPTPLGQEFYTYDGVGNRLTDSNIPGIFQYNANNQVTTAGSADYTYDPNGNVTTKTDAATLTIYTYAYDTDNRLTEIKQTDADSNTTTIARYVYDPFGRRLWKDTANGRTYFLYSDEGLIAEAAETGAVVRIYGYKPDSGWGTNPIYLKTNDQYFFYQNDHLGGPEKLIASDGTIAWSAKFQIFGRTTVDSASIVENNLRFPGQYHDEESGLHYNWHRYYDPSTGRYISSDPIGLMGGLNTYAYVDSNPLRWIDPDGKEKRGATPDTGPCSYYMLACHKYGCKYYCRWAPLICQTADVNPLFKRDPSATTDNLNCVRRCLVREDKITHAKKSLQRCDGCLTDDEVDQYHRVCFTECKINPDIYPSVGPLN